MNYELILPTLKKDNTFSSNNNNYSHHIWDLEIPYNDSKYVLLGPGQIILDEDLIIPSDKVLTVHPGTILRLNKDRLMVKEIEVAKQLVKTGKIVSSIKSKQILN